MTLSSASLELVARAIHAAYLEDHAASGQSPSLATGPWEHLPDEYRDSCRRQAADIDRKLGAIGWSIATAGAVADQPGVAFSWDETELLAEMEHDRWADDRRRNGWTLGPVRDDDQRQTPHLVPYADLPEAIKELDRQPVRRIPALVALAGLVLVPSPADRR